MSINNRDERLHQKALKLVRAAYDAADGMRKVDLDALNNGRPPTRRYHTQHELVREFIERASAMLNFAGHLGLIDSDEDVAMRRNHADLWEWMAKEDERLSAES